MGTQLIDTIQRVKQMIHTGISVSLPHYESLPELKLVLGKNHLPSLEYGANYFLQLSKVNDLNRMSTEMVDLYTRYVVSAETDLDQIYAKYNIESVKSYGKSIKADAVVADLSARNKLYKKNRQFIKSNNYLKENNFYISDYNMITLDIFRPLFEIGSEKFCIIKLPTLFGRTVINAIRIYCSVFKTVRLIKCSHDSWLKDSAVLVCSSVHILNLEKVISHIRSVTKSHSWKDANNIPYTIINESIEHDFIERVIDFSYNIYTTLYYIHTLLYNSMTSETKSVENEHQKCLSKLLRT